MQETVMMEYKSYPIRFEPLLKKGYTHVLFLVGFPRDKGHEYVYEVGYYNKSGLFEKISQERHNVGNIIIINRKELIETSKYVLYCRANKIKTKRKLKVLYKTKI